VRLTARFGLVTGRKGMARRALSSARLSPLDWVSLGIFAVALLAVAAGRLPVADASHTLRRILPLLGFLAAVIVLAEPSPVDVHFASAICLAMCTSTGPGGR
jgi:hypothetical protein